MKAEVDRNRFATELKHYLQQKLEGIFLFKHDSLSGVDMGTVHGFGPV